MKISSQPRFNQNWAICKSRAEIPPSPFRPVLPSPFLRQSLSERCILPHPTAGGDYRAVLAALVRASPRPQRSRSRPHTSHSGF